MMSESQLPTPDETGGLDAVSPAERKFDHWRRGAGFWLAPLAVVTVYFLADGLSPEGRKLSAILSGVLVLWITEALPLPVTAVLGTALCALSGVADARTVLAPFADPIVFLFIGSFILAEAMTNHGLDRRFALAILSLPVVGGRPTRVLCAIGLTAAALSMWVSNTATTAMMLPIGLGLLRTLEGTGSSPEEGTAGERNVRLSPYATGMLLMAAYGSSVGGIGTPVGSPPNLIGIGLIAKLAGVRIGFFQWMALCVPLTLALFGVLFALLRWLHPPRKGQAVASTDWARHLRQQHDSLGGWTRGQVNTLIAFAVAVVLWVGPGVLALTLGKEHPAAKFADTHLPESVVALLAACLLFVLPTDRKARRFTLTWQQAARIDWGTILLFGGGLSLGSLMFHTGVAESVGSGVVNLTGAKSLWTLTAVATAVAMLITETTSNTASANMVIPVVIALAQAQHVNPVPPALGACLAASFAFMLPVSTPPNAIVYGSGLVPVLKMVRAGVLLDLCGFVVIMVGLRILCPLLGLA